jgi:hypothetical protein
MNQFAISKWAFKAKAPSSINANQRNGGIKFEVG